MFYIKCAASKNGGNRFNNFKQKMGHRAERENCDDWGINKVLAPSKS